MNRLHSLRKSIMDMDLEELREHVRKIRLQRRIVKDKPAKKAKAVRAKAKTEDKVIKALSGMSEEEIRQLLGAIDDEDATEGNPSP